MRRGASTRTKRTREIPAADFGPAASQRRGTFVVGERVWQCSLARLVPPTREIFYSPITQTCRQVAQSKERLLCVPKSRATAVSTTWKDVAVMLARKSRIVGSAPRRRRGPQDSVNRTGVDKVRLQGRVPDPRSGRDLRCCRHAPITSHGHP